MGYSAQIIESKLFIETDKLDKVMDNIHKQFIHEIDIKSFGADTLERTLNLIGYKVNHVEEQGVYTSFELKEININYNFEDKWMWCLLEYATLESFIKYKGIDGDYWVWRRDEVNGVQEYEIRLAEVMSHYEFDNLIDELIDAAKVRDREETYRIRDILRSKLCY